jgi:hypothetical protein
MELGRRRLLALAAAAVAAGSRTSRAESYPSRPVHWIVGFAPGGSTDILARVIGQYLSEKLGQTFIIENRPGAGSNIATEVVVNAPPDGYTLLMISPAHAVNATLYDKLNYSFLRDIAPVAGISREANVMVVSPSFPATTVPAFIAYAKANPGKFQHGLVRRRHLGPCGGRAVQHDGGPQDDPHPLSRRGPGDYRYPRPPGAGDVRRDAVRLRARQGRPAARARGDHGDEVADLARRNSCRATRRARGTASARRVRRRPRSSTRSAAQ